MVIPIEFASRKVGPGKPVFIIAEAGVNHNGSLETAKHLVDAAVKAGADAVKFQTFKAENITLRLLHMQQQGITINAHTARSWPWVVFPRFAKYVPRNMRKSEFSLLSKRLV